MERKIGEIFEYNGEWYQCVEGLYCDNCAFVNDNCEDRERITLREKLTKQPTTGFCNSEKRNDRKSVIFKKLEKVGEPFKRNGYLYQEYKAHTYPLLMNGEAKLPTANGFAVKIKQNKEDMEEKNNAKHSNSEKIGKNLKPFDLQKAREGKPVCTRDGRKARIICFDRKGDYPIIALVEDIYGIEYVKYYTEKGTYFNYNDNKTSKNLMDLMMLPEKKEGWVNLTGSLSHNPHILDVVWDTKEEALDFRRKAPINADIIATGKITWEE